MTITATPKVTTRLGFSANKRSVLRLPNGRLIAVTLADNPKFVNVSHENGRTSQVKTAYIADARDKGRYESSTVQAFTAASKRA